MGYRVQTIDDTTNLDIGLGIDMSFSNPGVFKTLYTSKNQAKANIRNLLLTRLGERYNHPNFGTNLLSVIFQPSTSETKELINTEVTSAISFWLPYIRIEQLEILDEQDDPTLIHTIKITLKYSVNEFDTDSIVIFANEDSSQLIIE